MRGLFADIVGQEMAVSILSRALEQGASHAYLFSGPPGVGKSEAALAFAAGLACADGGCGACTTCRRVQEGLHPDVEIVAPEGNFIRKEEITEINLHAVYRPYEARAKVYVFLEADNFNAEAANAFLKTLEEPPAHVHFILVTDHPERLLPTIASRCQSVTFSPVPAPALAADLVSRFGTVRSARPICLARVAGGNLTYARELATSESARRQRDLLLDLARDLPTASLMDTQVALDEVMATVESRAAERVGRVGGRAEAGAGVGRRRPDAQVAREAPRGEAEAAAAPAQHSGAPHRHPRLRRLVSRPGSGLRRSRRRVLNQDRLEELRAAALPGGLLAYTQAVMAVRQAQERLRYNVDARCAIGDMFRSIKEALTQWPML